MHDAKLTDLFDPELTTLNATAIRRAFAFLGQQQADPQQGELIAKHMKHSVVVRDRHYVYDENGEISRKVTGVFDRALFSEELLFSPEEDVSQPAPACE